MNKNQLLYIRSLYEMMNADNDKRQIITRSLFGLRNRMNNEEIKGITEFISRSSLS